jgi:hypothetical protein
MPDRDTILGGAAVLTDKTKVNLDPQPLPFFRVQSLYFSIYDATAMVK